MSLTEDTRASAAEIVSRYPEGRSRSALLPMLHLVQAEEGYVTPQGIAFCAEVLGLTKAEVGAVATFYTMYKRRPTGEYLVSVCTNLSCQILGGEDVFSRVAERLGVHHNETTPDGTFTLEHAECLAACDFAPVVTVNYEFFDNVTPDSAEALIDDLAAGKLPVPTRGAPLCSFKEMSRQLAGFRDPRPAAVGAGVAHPEPGTSPDSRGTQSAVQVLEAEPTPGPGAPHAIGDEPIIDPEATADSGELARSEPPVVTEVFQKNVRDTVGSTDEESTNL
jgi:NADH-quinone oxidoreductase subunit E